MVDTSQCPCGLDKHYKQCCELLHKTIIHAESAEILMRSRFSAYVKKNQQYLLDTWHSSTRPSEINFEGPGGFRWIKLTINESKEADKEAMVDFTAHYLINGQQGQMQEHSRFIKEDGFWYYAP